MLNLSSLHTIHSEAVLSGTHCSSGGGTAGMINFPDPWAEARGTVGEAIKLIRRVRPGGVLLCFGVTAARKKYKD